MGRIILSPEKVDMMPCKRPDCGGVVLRFSDGRRLCCLCSRPYDENGNLIEPQVANENTMKVPHGKHFAKVRL